MKHLAKFALVLVVLLLTLAPLAACKQAAPTVQKPTVVRIGVITDATGPYAAIAGPTLDAYLDAQAYVNDTGGIDGVPIEVVVRDGAGKVDLATSMYTELVNMSPRPVMLNLIVSAYAEALHDRIAEDEIPTLSVTATSAIYPRAYTFGMYLTYADFAGLFADWLMKTWKGSAPPKVAFLTWDSTYGRAILTQEVRDYFKSKGVNLVAEEVFKMADLDVTTQLVRIRDKGADWIYSNSTATGPVVVLKGLKQLGYNVPFAGAIGFDWSCMYISTKELVEGSVAIFNFVSWDETDNPGIQKMTEYFDKASRPAKDRTVLYPLGFQNVLICKEVIGRAVKEVGWDKLSGEAIKAQLLKLKNFSALGISTITYTADRYSPSLARVYQFKDGKLLPVSDWMEAPNLLEAKYK
ncbi:MAG: ABC transporter substrate-binding protein [Chloroflexota bacterium]